MIILGTSNLNKLKEYQKIVPSFDFKLMDKMDIIENGYSFMENATIKANAVYEKYHETVLCDDSGLEILALKGFPGIYSSRFESGRGFKKTCEDLLDKLKDYQDRRARFVCCVVMIDKYGDKYSAIGYLNGTIAYEYLGDNGFGYDPIFIPDGYNKTLGQLDEETKNKISHRYLAMTNLINKLPQRILRRLNNND